MLLEEIVMQCNSRLIKIAVMTVLAVVATACVSCDDMDKSSSNLVEVWTKSGWPPKEMAAPDGFTLTPEEAFKRVAEGKKLSLKHNWICYRDATHYYIADAFAQRSNAKTAIKYGVRVNGATGALE